jgi:hypothetical protein
MPLRSFYLCFALALLVALPLPAAVHRTVVSISGDSFLINGRATYAGRFWRGQPVAGLLMNARMVQGIFDDQNPATVGQWAYPDTGRWDPERNTNEFVTAMPEWKRHGLLAFTINLQGGSPYGYSKDQPWENSAFAPNGDLRPAYMARLERILDRADSLGMVAIVGYFYVSQAARLRDDGAVVKAADNATNWLLAHGWRNVLVEIDNECDLRFRSDLLGPGRVAELIEREQKAQKRGHRLLVGTSFRGGSIPVESVVRASDFLLLHGNGVADPAHIGEMVRATRAVPGYVAKPILFNEDDHYGFDQPENNMSAAVAEHASWGYFDYRRKGEGFEDGFQNVPADWSIDSPRKRAFFHLLAEVTGAEPMP